MKNIITSIVLLITLFIVFLACTEDEPKKETPSDVTSETTLICETTHIEEIEGSDEISLPEIPENIDNIEYGKIYAGGCVYFKSIEAGDIEGSDTFLGFFSEVGEREIENYDLISRVFFGKNTFFEVELGRDDIYECEYIIKSITAFGTKYEFTDDKFVAHCNQGLFLYELDDKTVFSRNYVANTEYTDAFSLWVIDANGVHHMSSGIEEACGTPEYNCSKYHYYIGDNNELQYERYLLKYSIDRLQIIGQELQYCTGRDEFCYETGTVTFDGLTPIYSPDKVYTAGEVFDLDGTFDYAYNTFSEELKENNINTLDELLEYHNTIYQKGK